VVGGGGLAVVLGVVVVVVVVVAWAAHCSRFAYCVLPRFWTARVCAGRVQVNPGAAKRGLRYATGLTYQSACLLLRAWCPLQHVDGAVQPTIADQHTHHWHWHCCCLRRQRHRHCPHFHLHIHPHQTSNPYDAVEMLCTIGHACLHPSLSTRQAPPSRAIRPAAAHPTPTPRAHLRPVPDPCGWDPSAESVRHQPVIVALGPYSPCSALPPLLWAHTSPLPPTRETAAVTLAAW
jgi:hypothetical protein